LGFESQPNPAGRRCALTIHEGAPLIAQDTQFEQEFFALLEHTTTVTPEVGARIDQIIAEQTSANARLVEFNKPLQAKGCK
jgi:hypothetical protein